MGGFWWPFECKPLGTHGFQHVMLAPSFFKAEGEKKCIVVIPGLTDPQMDGQRRSWGTPRPHNQHHPMLATATRILMSPTPTRHAAPSAQTCFLVPTPLCPGTPCDICPVRTHDVPHRNLALMNRWVVGFFVALLSIPGGNINELY